MSALLAMIAVGIAALGLVAGSRAILAGGWNRQRFLHGLCIAIAGSVVAYGLVFLAIHGSVGLGVIAGVLVVGAGSLTLRLAHQSRQRLERPTNPVAGVGSGIPAALCGLAIALIAGATVLGLLADSSATEALTSGWAVNAASGEIEDSPHIAAPTGSAQIDGGDFLRGCDLSRERTCRFDSPPKEMVVHRGDTLQFLMLLHNSGWTPVPYAKFFVDAGPRLEVKPPGIGVALTIAWPVKGDLSEAERLFAYPVKVRLATPAPHGFHLRYIRGSTILQRRNHSVIARLPDGLFSPLGLALTNIGALKGCFDCNDQYDRFVGFKMRVE
jgi:hypothetical protein